LPPPPPPRLRGGHSLRRRRRPRCWHAVLPAAPALAPLRWNAPGGEEGRQGPHVCVWGWGGGACTTVSKGGWGAAGCSGTGCGALQSPYGHDDINPVPSRPPSSCTSSTHLPIPLGYLPSPPPPPPPHTLDSIPPQPLPPTTSPPHTHPPFPHPPTHPLHPPPHLLQPSRQPRVPRHQQQPLQVGRLRLTIPLQQRQRPALQQRCNNHCVSGVRRL
jgi:hypothetical protein